MPDEVWPLLEIEVKIMTTKSHIILVDINESPTNLVVKNEMPDHTENKFHVSVGYILIVNVDHFNTWVNIRGYYLVV